MPSIGMPFHHIPLEKGELHWMRQHLVAALVAVLSSLNCKQSDLLGTERGIFLQQRKLRPTHRAGKLNV